MIKLDHVNKYYNRGGNNELHVMNDVSLELPAKGMIALFGKSGCGKTTLLNAIGGLDKINDGEILVFGENIAKKTDYIRNKYIGYIFQNYNLAPGETVFENVADALRLCGVADAKEIEERVLASLASVGMEKFKNRFPDTLSGGQQQRVAIARALVKNPAVILADEPTGNLDEANTVMVMDLLQAASRDHLVLLVTHEAELVDYYCSRVIEIVDGRINSVRDNDDANGYVSRDKNDIYLGELPRSEGELPGVHIEYYGKPEKEISLRIVSVDGKLYLQSRSPQVKILDSFSEIKLKEGVFEEKGNKKTVAENAPELPQIKPIEGKRFGRLFTLPSAIMSGFRENFTKKSKKGHKLLIASMFLLAAVVVFMSANFAVGLRAMTNVYAVHNENIFYLPVSSTTDTSKLADSSGENGIDNFYIIESNYIGKFNYINFRCGNFITASLPSVDGAGVITDARMLKNRRLVCGSLEFKRPYDIVISTAFADKMLENSKLEFVKRYENLLNMVSDNYYGDTSGYLRIIGVVESDERNVYMQSLYAARTLLTRAYGLRLKLTSQTLYGNYDGDIAAGSVVYCYKDSDGTAPSDTVMIMGQNYDVIEKIALYDGTNGYADFFMSDNGSRPELSSPLNYYAYIKQSDPTADLYQCSFEWFFDHYGACFKEYCERSVNIEESAYIYLTTGKTEHLIESLAPLSLGAALNLSDFDVKTNTYAAYCYRQQNGNYPTEVQLAEFINSNLKLKSNYNEIIQNDLSFYEVQYSQHKNASNPLPFYIMNDDDYVSLTYKTGLNDSTVMNFGASSSLEGMVIREDIFAQTGYFANEKCPYYSLAIHADDAAAAKSFLVSQYGENALIFPEDVLNENLKSVMSQMVISLIFLVVLIAVICLSIYFIMRSSLMHRINEIGIYRAIGVSKKNLLFRFVVEAAVVAMLSLFIGYIVAAILVNALATGFLAQVFYFPIWLALVVLILLFSVTVACGIIPVAMLLRKTPSEILSKYDI